MGMIFTIDSVFDFERKCLDVNKELLDWINNKSQIKTPTDIIRPRLLVFYKQLGESFDCNCEFILDVLKKNGKLEPVVNIIRTVIELYCRVLYLDKVSDKEKTKKVVGLDVYTIAICGIDDEYSSSMIKGDQEIASSLEISLPSINDLRKRISDAILFLNKNKELVKFKNHFFFPSVKTIIKKYLDEAEEPRIQKSDLYLYYSLMSDQIHGNPYLGQHIPNKSPRNRTLGLLIMLSLGFIKQMESLTNFSKEKTESLILTWKNYVKPYFSDLMFRTLQDKK